MSLEYFNPLLRVNDLIQDLKWDEDLRVRFEVSEEDVITSYPLTNDERDALRMHDFRRLYEMGMHPYLLSQYARLLHGNGEKAGSSSAATALLESLLGDEYTKYMASRAE